MLAITFTISCEDKEKDKPAEANTVAAVPETAVTASPPETAEKTVPDKRETFTDSRDGKTYKKVTIGSQTWMAENLNYDAKGSKCYEDKPENCEKYGRLYDWETAMKACPSGWHLPTKDEWEAITAYAGGESTGGEKLKAKSGWNDYDGASGNGTDDFGFSALPGGELLDGRLFQNVGDVGRWWSASEDDGSEPEYASDGDAAYDWNAFSRSDVILGLSKKSFCLYSIRCIKD